MSSSKRKKDGGLTQTFNVASAIFVVSALVTAAIAALFSGAGIVTSALPSWALAIMATGLILIFAACYVENAMKVFGTVVLFSGLLLFQSGGASMLTPDINERPFGKMPSLHEIVEIISWFGVVAYAVGGIVAIFVLLERTRHKQEVKKVDLIKHQKTL